MSIDEIQREIEYTAKEFNFIRNIVKVDVTDFSVKYRLMIDKDFYKFTAVAWSIEDTGLHQVRQPPVAYWLSFMFASLTSLLRLRNPLIREGWQV